MADRIIEDRYIFDLSGDDAVREILQIVDALEKQTTAAKTAGDAAGKLGTENKKLADIEKQLAAVLAQEAKSVDGLASKRLALNKISAKLTDEQKKQLGIAEKLVKVENDLATAAAKAAKGQGKLNDTFATGATRIGALVKASAGLGALAFTLDQAAQKVQELDGFIQSTQSSIQGLTREGATVLAGDIIGSEITFGIDRDEILGAVKTGASEFKEDAESVLNDLNIGLINATTQEAREELVAQIRELSTRGAEAGLTFKTQIEAINLADSLGIYSDKALSAIGETGIRLRERTKPVIDAVTNALGDDFSGKLFSDIEKGLPSFEALKQISAEVGRVDLNQQQWQELVSTIGGGDLEDAGRRFFESVKDIGEGVDGVVTGLTAYQAAQADLLQTNREIGRTQTQVADELSDLTREYANSTAGIRLFVSRGVLTLVTALKQLPGFIKENKIEIGALIAAFSITQIGAFVSGVKSVTTAFKAQIVQARLLALANPYTAAIASVTALIAVTSILLKEKSKEAEIAERVSDSTKRLSVEYGNEKREVDALFKTLNTAKEGTDEFKAAKDRLQENYGEYLENVRRDKEGNLDLADAYDKVTAGILRSVLAREQARLQEEITQQIIDKTIELNNVTESTADIGQRLGAVFGSALNTIKGTDEFATSASGVVRSQLQSDINALKEQFNDIPEVLKVAEQQLKDLDFGANIEPATARTNEGVKRIQRSTKQLKDETEKLKEAAETVEQRLAKLGVTIDGSFAASVENAGTQSEGLTLILDQLETQLTALEGEAKKGATLATLPQLEALLASIREEQGVIDDARQILARQSIEIAPIETITPDEIVSTADVPELPVNIILDAPEKKDIEAIFLQVLEGAESVFADAFSVFDAISGSQAAALDGLVSKQEEIISEIEANSEDYNARQLDREKARLDELEREQAAAAERARTIAKVEVAAQAALAIAKAATLPFPGNLIAISSTIAALVAGFANINSAAAGAFFEGTDYLERPNGVPAGRDTIHIRANEGERITPTADNMKLKRHGIVKNDDLIKYAIRGKMFDTSPMQSVQAGSSALGAQNMADVMRVVGIPINNSQGVNELKSINAYLRKIEGRLSRDKFVAPKVPVKR